MKGPAYCQVSPNSLKASECTLIRRTRDACCHERSLHIHCVSSISDTDFFLLRYMLQARGVFEFSSYENPESRNGSLLLFLDLKRHNMAILETSLCKTHYVLFLMLIKSYSLLLQLTRYFEDTVICISLKNFQSFIQTRMDPLSGFSVACQQLQAPPLYPLFLCFQ